MEKQMVDAKKLMALKNLISEMFKLEEDGDGDDPISKHAITEAMAPDPSEEHEALESPKEEKMEHETGLEAMDELAEEKRKFMKQSRVNPVGGKTKAVILKAEVSKPKMSKYDK